MIAMLYAATIFTGSFTVETPIVTASYNTEKKAVTIKWQQKNGTAKTFILQHSSDNFNWVDIARIENTTTSNTKTWQYIDDNPESDENYYRLQTITATGSKQSTVPIMIFGGGTFKWNMYPVPVTDLLTLQYKGTAKITGVINVTIQNMQGFTLTRLRCASNSTSIQIPVTNLGKGAYNIFITLSDKVVWSQRFVK